MYGPEAREVALRLVAEGRSLNGVSLQLGISRSSLREWRDHPDPLRAARTCLRCQAPPGVPDAFCYAHLLGLYLGDGCISAGAKGVYSLRIACCDDYPRLMDECEESVRAVRSGRVGRTASIGCAYITAHSKHWPCLFPQHGPGRKHERSIVLEAWQVQIVEEHAGRFLRGLFHSDGCRITNWTTRPVAGAVKRYEYPRYFFSNASADIRGLCCWATHPSERNISVARKQAVAVLDQHVGPKS
jgi:hypothetical protein